jgi:hypothetical protein
VKPPASLMAPMPTVPSLPPPESTTPIACSPLSSASEYRSASTRLGTGAEPSGDSTSGPSLTVSVEPEGQTYT